jgi:hypothetical protein
MNLEDTKVIIVDDKPEEVKILFDLLNKNKIAYNYYSGSKPGLPGSPFSAVRIIFLDFVLWTDGQSEKTKISTLMGVMKKILGPANGPYIVLLWTKHAELIEAFKSALMSEATLPKPVKIIDLDKNECLKKHNLGVLKRSINEKFNDNEIAKLILHWERQSNNAATDVLATLAEISRPDSGTTTTFDDYSRTWNRNLEGHCYKFAEAALGKNLTKPKDMLIAIQTIMSILFQDHFESVVRRDPGPFSPLVGRLTRPSDHYRIDLKGKLNTFFLLSTGVSRGSHPGNIYTYRNIWPHVNKGKLKLGVRKILQEFSNSSDIINDDRFGQLCAACIPVFIEITPVCDFAQQNQKTERFLLGILWPVDGSRQRQNYIDQQMKSKADFLYPILPVRYNDKSYNLTFNSRWLFTANLRALKQIRPILRARNELLVDIQHWFANHFSRPGKTQFS